MRYGHNLSLSKDYAVNGNLYQLVSIRSYGRGLLAECKQFFFEPYDKKLPRLSAFQWKDGHIDRLKVVNKH
jgi:hypothetical protein